MTTCDIDLGYRRTEDVRPLLHVPEPAARLHAAAELTARACLPKAEGAGEGDMPPATPPAAPHLQWAYWQARNGGAAGRIPIPTTAMTLWAQHKYSVMARDPGLAKQIGREVAAAVLGFDTLSAQLVRLLAETPAPGRLWNALQHMWGYVALPGPPPETAEGLWRELCRRASRPEAVYVRHSTALGELGRYVLATT